MGFWGDLILGSIADATINPKCPKCGGTSEYNVQATFDNDYKTYSKVNQFEAISRSLSTDPSIYRKEYYKCKRCKHVFTE